MAMTQDQQEAMLRDAQEELRKAQSELAVAQRRVLNLQQIVRGFSGLLHPEQEDESRASDASDAPRPSGARLWGMSGASRIEYQHAVAAAEATVQELDRIRAGLRRELSTSAQRRHAAALSEKRTSADRELPSLPGLETVPAPRPRDAVFQAMQSRPNVPLAPREVVSMVKERGLFDGTLKSGSNSYTTALMRLSEDPTSPIVRRENGMYSFEAPETSDTGGAISGN